MRRCCAPPTSGIDAAVRTWLDDQPGYLPPVQLGEVIRAAGIGEVVASRCDAYAVGDVVTTLTGFQEYVIIRDDVFSTPDPRGDRPARDHVGLRPDRCHRLLRDDRHRQAAARGDGGGVGRGGRHRIGGRADRQDRRRAGRGHRGRPGEVPGGGRGLRVRRLHRLQGGRPAGRAQGALPARASTSTSTTSAGRSSTRCWAGWPRRRGSCSAASSPAT